MGNKEHVEQNLLNIDINSYPDKTDNEFFLHDLLDVGLKAGRFIFFGISYSIKLPQLSSSEFFVKNHPRHKLILKCLQFGFFMFMIVPFLTESVFVSPCFFVNWMKRGLYTVRILSIMVAYYVFEGRNSTEGWTKIFQQCVTLQMKFRDAGLHFTSRINVRKFGWGIFLSSLIICIIRHYMIATHYVHWYDRYARYISRSITLGFWKPNNVTTPEYVSITLGVFGVAFDGILTNYWYFCQIFHFFCVLTIWIVFDKLNKTWKSGHYKKNQLSELLELHFHSLKLLNLLNSLISPLTFWLLVFNFAGMCVWACYITVDFEARVNYFAAVGFFLKTLLELCLQADVNSKTHQISDWLEESCTLDEKFPKVDPVKLAAFTSQVYNKDSTGIKGLNYFVITPRLCITLIGIIVTYTVAVKQLCM